MDVGLEQIEAQSIINVEMTKRDKPEFKELESSVSL